MPNTMLNWKSPASLPRSRGGEISAMKSGAAMVEIPTPTPPMKRKTMKDHTSHAIPEPTADTK